MAFEELYSKASKGDENAQKELIDYAEQGEADAQYLLFCLYDMDGPFKNEEQANYWLDMAAYNGSQQAKDKVHERPFRPVRHHTDEEDSLAEEPVDESIPKHMGSEEETTRWKIRILWWIVFPVLLVLYHINKCERDAESNRAFRELMTPMDQKSENFNPSEHIQMDPDLHIKVDEEYIEHLEGKTKRVQ